MSCFARIDAVCFNPTNIRLGIRSPLLNCRPPLGTSFHREEGSVKARVEVPTVTKRTGSNITADDKAGHIYTSRIIGGNRYS